MQSTVLREPELLKDLKISHTTLWSNVRAGKFPAPIKLGSRAVGWLRSEVDLWLANRVTERDQKRCV